MIIRIAVADLNSEYVSRLTGVLEEHNDLRISGYSDIECLANAIDAGRFDVLLLDPSMYDPALRLDRLNAVIVLMSDTPIPNGCERFDTVRKFQKIGKIYSKILSICSEKLRFGAKAGIGMPASVLSFYSPVGGSGKTSAALIAASKLALCGHPTFYLNLESYPSDEFYFTPGEQEGFSALLERIASGQPEATVSVFMRSCFQSRSDGFSENLFFMKHFDSPNDYEAIEPDELVTLIDLLRRAGGFEYIVIDTESGLGDKIKTVFAQSDRIVITEKQDAISRRKLESFYAQSYIIDEYGFKMSRIINFYNPNGKDVIQNSIPIIGYIGQINGVDCEALIKHKLECAEAGFALKLIGETAE